MKKKIFLMLAIVAMLVCVFAISASASDRTTISYTDASGEVHQVPIVKFTDATTEDVASAMGHTQISRLQAMADDSAYAILRANDGTLTAYPSWYIIEPSGAFSNDYIAVSEINYAYINSMVTDKSYGKGAIRYIEFPEGMTELRSNSVFNGYETNVTDVYIPSTVTTIGTEGKSGAVFTDNQSLKRVFVAQGSKLNTILEEAFRGSALEYFQFENATELTVIKADAFYNCNLAGSLDLGKTKLVTIASPATDSWGTFAGNPNITAITLPDTLETLGNRAFYGCTNAYFSNPYLPSSLKYVGEHFMTQCKNLNETFIFPEGVSQIPREMFNSASRPNGEGTLNVVFLGKMTTLMMNGSDYRAWAENINVYFAQNTLSDVKASIYSFTDKIAGTLGTSNSQSGTLTIDVSGKAPSSTTQVDGNFNLRFIFCGSDNSVEISYCLSTDGNKFTEDRGIFEMNGHTHYGAGEIIEATCGKDGGTKVSCIICDTYVEETYEATGNHNYENNICTVCGNKWCVGGNTHALKKDAIYENGFTCAGIIVNKCQNEGCAYVETVGNVSALFTCLGYSANEVGGDGIAIGYLVNNEAIDEYTSITGKSISYGVFVASQNKLGENDIFDQEGNKTGGVVSVEITSYEFAVFELKVVGFTDENKGSLLAMGAYVKEVDGESAEYSYMQDDTNGEKLGNYYFVSYNSVVNSLS